MHSYNVICGARFVEFKNLIIFSFVDTFVVKNTLLFFFFHGTDCDSSTGIGYTLDPEFSFVKIAAPYAQVYFCNLRCLYLFPTIVYLFLFMQDVYILSQP